MPFRWVQTEGFKSKPYHCIACGQAPVVQDEDGVGHPDVAYWMEGSDVNWGDSILLCSSCVRILGELAGFLIPEVSEKLRKQVRELKENVKRLEGERDEYKQLNESMLAGARARKTSKEKVNA